MLTFHKIITIPQLQDKIPQKGIYFARNVVHLKFPNTLKANAAAGKITHGTQRTVYFTVSNEN